MIREIISKRYKLHFNAFAVIPGGDIGYASSIESNGLFEVKMSTGECSFLDMFPNEGQLEKNLHWSAAYCKGRAFFFPQRGEYISIYEIQEQTFKQIEIPPCKYPYYYKHIKIGQAFCYGEKVYAVGASYPYVILIDGNTLDFTFIPMEIGERKIMFRSGGCFAEGNFFVPSTVSKLILSIDLSDDTLKIYSIAIDDPGVWGMAYDGGKFWLAPFYKQSAVRTWNSSTGEIHEYAEFPDGYAPGRFPFFRCIFVEKYIWMWPLNANMALCIDPGSGEMKKAPCGIDFSKNWITESYPVADFVFCIRQKKGKNDGWQEPDVKDYIFDFQKRKGEEYSFVLVQGTDEFMHNIFKGLEEKLTDGVRESSGFLLEDFLIVELDESKETAVIKNEKQSNAGAVIYNAIIKILD